MKEKTKQKLNNAKEYIVEHKDDIITYCATTAAAVLIGRACGAMIGKYIVMTNAAAYQRGWQNGVTDCHDRMLSDNVDKPEVVKALVDFQHKYTK